MPDDDYSPERLLRPDDAAGVLGVGYTTLLRWRYDGTGPAHVRTPGGHVRYRQADLDTYIRGLERTGGEQ